MSEIIDVEEEMENFLVFSLGEDLYALPGENVREILPPTEVFPVPGCPQGIEGVINVRGDIESVIDLRGMLGSSARDETASSSGALTGSILLGKTKTMQSGIRADRVMDVLSLPKSAIYPPNSALSERLRPLASGLLMYGDRAVSILDLDKALEAFSGAAE